MQYGSIPAGGLGTRLQPIGFSKELAPVGGRAVIEYFIERLLLAGIDKIFINTADDKSDLIRYLATKSQYRNNLIFLVRERKGLLDGIAQPTQFLRQDDELYFGLPDTIWFPKNGFQQIKAKAGKLVLGLFKTSTPERFDSVVTDKKGKIQSIEVKVASPKSTWTWGIGKVQVSEIPTLLSYRKILFGESMYEYAKKHKAFAVQLKGSRYLDIGQLEEYRKAEKFLTKYDK